MTKEKALARMKTLSKESQIAVLLAVKDAKLERQQQNQQQDKPQREMKSLKRLAEMNMKEKITEQTSTKVNKMLFQFQQ